MCSYSAAAEQGLADAQHSLSSMLFRSCSVCDLEGVLVEAASGGGDGNGGRTLPGNGDVDGAGGRGVHPEHVKAAKWCRLAAEQGHALAQFNLGAMHELGHGVDVDLAAAASW